MSNGSFIGMSSSCSRRSTRLSCIPLSYNVVIDPVGLTLYKLLHQVINTLEVFVCSAEFEKRAIERVHLLTPVTEAVIDARLKISYSRAERLEGKADRKERRESRENRKISLR